MQRIEEEEGGLMTHEITPENRLQHQIQLATDMYLVLHGEKSPDESKEEYRNRIMFFWTDDEHGDSFSKIYSDIEKDKGFGFHSRLQGDIYRITPADMLYYKEHGELPEE